MGLLTLLQTYPVAVEPPPGPTGPTGPTAGVTATAGTPYESAASVTTATITLPTGLAAGDYTLLICSANGTTPVITTPTGWTALFPSTQSTASNSHTAAVFYRPWQAGDTDPTITTTTARLAVLPVRVQGADPTTLLDTAVASTSAAAGSTAITAPGQTPATTGQLFVVAAGRLGSSGTILTLTPPPGMTEVGEADSRSTTQSNASAALYVQDVTVGADTGTRTATASSSSTGSRGISFVLKGAPAPVTDPRPSGIYFDYRADDAIPTYATATTGTPVIPDTSANTRPGLVFAASAQRPTLNTGGANGHQYLTFDGVDDRLTTSNSTDPSMLTFLNGKPGGTVAAVVRLPNGVAATTRYIAHFSTTTAAARMGIYADSNSTWAVQGRRLDADTTQGTNSTLLVDTDLHLLVGVNDYANATQRLYLDGQLIGERATFQTAGSTSATNALTFNIGSNATPSLFFNGELYELLGYDRALTPTEVDHLWTYGRDRYALTAASPPAGGTAAYDGAGGLSFTGAPTAIGAATYTGAGTLTGTGAATIAAAGTLNLTGSGALTAGGVPRPVGAAAYVGDGTLTATGVPTQAGAGTAAYAGAGQLTTTGTPRPAAAAGYTGAGTLTFTGTPRPTGTAGYTGSGALTFTTTPRTTGAATYTGGGAYTTTGALTAAAALTLTGDGVLTQAGAPRPAGAATYAGDGNLTATGTPRPVGVLALAGDGTLATTGAGTQSNAGTATYTGAGTLTAAPKAVTAAGAAAFTGTGALTYTAAPRTGGAAVYAGAGTLTTGGAGTSGGTATYAGSGTLTYTPTPRPTGTAAFTGGGQLTYTTLPRVSGAATYTGTGAYTAGGFSGRGGNLTLTGTGQLQLTGAARGAGTAAYTGGGTYTTGGAPKAAGVATYTGTGGLSFTGLRPAITSTITGVGHLSMSAALFVDEPTTPTVRDITVTVTGPTPARRHVTGPAGTHLHVTGPTPAPLAVLGSVT